MNRLILIALLSTGVSAQDRALTAAEYEAQWVDVVESVDAPTAVVESAPPPECLKLAKKAKRGMIWKMLAVSIASNIATSSTAHYSTKINGQRYTSNITYRDPVKVYQARQVSNTAHNNIIAGTQYQYEKLGCGKLRF